jgi:hypothetical protein
MPKKNALPQFDNLRRMGRVSNKAIKKLKTRVKGVKGIKLKGLKAIKTLKPKLGSQIALGASRGGVGAGMAGR